jgi:hypothetical protein
MVLGCCALVFLSAACGGGGSKNAASTSSSSQSAASADDSILLRDDLSKKNHDWSDEEDQDVSVHIAQGGYQVKITGDTVLNLEASDAPKGDSVSVEADATLNATTVDTQLGVFCRRNDKGDTLYSASISADGFWGIFKRVSGKSTALKTAPADPDPAIKGSKGDHDLVRLDCEGAAGDPVTLSLSVNGKEIASTTDAEPLDVGTFGIRIGGAGTDVTWHDFVAKKLQGYSDQPAGGASSFGAVTFKDDFSGSSDVGNAWNTPDTENVTYTENGEYRMLVKPASFVALSEPDCSVKVAQKACDALDKMAQDVSVEVDATQKGGGFTTAAGGYGIACRAQMRTVEDPPPFGVLSGYAFLVAGDGSFLIDRVDSTGKQTALASGRAGSFIPGGTNHLRADCSGSGTVQLAFFVNDEEVGHTADLLDLNGTTTFTPHVGLVVATNSEGGLDVSFDNFTVRE